MSRRAPGSRPRKSGGVWQIIYMDLMTTMMVFFVILWSAEKESKKAERDGLSQTVGDQTVRMVNLPGDVLFPSGATDLTDEGEQVFSRLFGDDPSAVLSFDVGGLARRQLVIHGHTDSVGDKEENFRLGYQRAFSVYKEIEKYGAEVPDHVVICTHADNSPAQPEPVVEGAPTDAERQALRDARGHNRRIAIEDQMVNLEEERGAGEGGP